MSRQALFGPKCTSRPVSCGNPVPRPPPSCGLAASRRGRARCRSRSPRVYGRARNGPRIRFPSRWGRKVFEIIHDTGAIHEAGVDRVGTKAVAYEHAILFRGVSKQTAMFNEIERYLVSINISTPYLLIHAYVPSVANARTWVRGRLPTSLAGDEGLPPPLPSHGQPIFPERLR